MGLFASATKVQRQIKLVRETTARQKRPMATNSCGLRTGQLPSDSPPAPTRGVAKPNRRPAAAKFAYDVNAIATPEEVDVYAPQTQKPRRRGNGNESRRRIPGRQAQEHDCRVSEPRPTLRVPPAIGLTVSPELRGGLHELWQQIATPNPELRSNRIFAVVHWCPGDGGTTVAAALAFHAASCTPQHTFCLVDFDFLNPGLSFCMGLHSEPGVCNILAGETTVDQSLAESIHANLAVMPIGSPPLGPQVYRRVRRCGKLIRSLSRRVDYVFVDMPQLASHGGLLAPLSDLCRAVVVIRAGETQEASAAQVMETVQSYQLDVAGMVLNATDGSSGETPARDY